MKHIWFAIMFVALNGNIALADDLGFTGEWVVDSDVSGSRITVTEHKQAQQGWPPPFVNQRSLADMTPSDFERLRRSQEASTSSTSQDFTLITEDTFFEFAVNGSMLTGSIIRGKTEDPIFDGKISGNKITFTVREILKGRTYSYSYTGELSDDGIRFDVMPPRGGGNRFQFTARRVTQ